MVNTISNSFSPWHCYSYKYEFYRIILYHITIHKHIRFVTLSNFSLNRIYSECGGGREVQEGMEQWKKRGMEIIYGHSLRCHRVRYGEVCTRSACSSIEPQNNICGNGVRLSYIFWSNYNCFDDFCYSRYLSWDYFSQGLVLVQ